MEQGFLMRYVLTINMEEADREGQSGSSEDAWIFTYTELGCCVVGGAKPIDQAAIIPSSGTFHGRFCGGGADE